MLAIFHFDFSNLQQSCFLYQIFCLIFLKHKLCVCAVCVCVCVFMFICIFFQHHQNLVNENGQRGALVFVSQAFTSIFNLRGKLLGAHVPRSHKPNPLPLYPCLSILDFAYEPVHVCVRKAFSLVFVKPQFRTGIQNGKGERGENGSID